MPARNFVSVARSHSRHEFVVLTGVVEKEERHWVATCAELGIAAQARSVSEALSRLMEAITLHLETLEDVGELERFLAQNNIPVHKVEPKRPRLQIDSIKPGALATAIVRQLPEHNNQRELTYA